MRSFLVRLASLFRRRRLDVELDDEVQFHIEMLSQEHMRRGLSAGEARAAALRTFGGVIQMKESYREQRGLPSVEMFLQDARYGIRALLRNRGFTAAALLTLALGIGANSAIFSVVNAVLLRPLDYADPDRIVQMHRRSGGLWAGQTGRRYMFFRDEMKSFHALAAWRGTAFNLASGDIAEFVPALAVSKEYFTVFAGTPLFGRVFDADEDRETGPDAVILRYPIWKRMFGADPSVVGRSISLGDRSFTVVGVMPQGFDSIRTAEIYVPLKPGTKGPGGGTNYTVGGRLRRGVTLEQANAESDSVFEAYKASLPNSKFEGEFSPVFISYQEGLSRPVKPALLLMLGAVGMLLLIACANTANLLLARASGRGREISVRAALGASRTRIVRQLLTEAVLLFMTGGLLGIALAYWAVPVLLMLMPVGFLPPMDVRVDATVLFATLALSIITGIVFGLAPALSLSRQDLVEAFKDDGTRATAGRRSSWLRQGLVVGEVAVCMLLLVGAGLLVQTFVKLRSVDPGFDARNLLAARMSLRGERYATAASVNRLYELGLERIRRIPGVQTVAVVNSIPMEFGLNLNVDFLETQERETALTDWRYATSDYFRTMGIPITSGRAFDERDRAGAPRVAVVSEEFARRFYKEGRPLGRRIRVFDADGSIEVVGIVKNLREQGLSGPVPAVMYVPVAQTHDAEVRTSHGYFQVNWIVRASTISPELTHRIREELRAIDPTQPITAFRSMDEVKARAMETETFQMTLLTAFAVIGLVLAAAGIYGLIAYSVAQRTREFGIRLALGATRLHILTGVVRQGALLAVAGVMVGAGTAAVFTRSLQQFIFGVDTLDVTTLMAVGLLLVVVAIAASVVPALRAVRLNPVSALREG
jgi:putative ABC transport system permease protein